MIKVVINLDVEVLQNLGHYLLIKILENVGQRRHFILRLPTGGENEQIVWHILYCRELSFANIGREILVKFCKISSKF